MKVATLRRDKGGEARVGALDRRVWSASPNVPTPQPFLFVAYEDRLIGIGFMIRIVNVSKTYESADGEAITALCNLNLEVDENEFLAIVGPSGCGKSTLLKLM